MTLNFGLDVSFGNLEDRKGIPEEGSKLIVRKLVQQIMISVEFPTGVTLVF
jgi:hypothetical protein